MTRGSAVVRTLSSVAGLGGIDDASVEHMVQNVRPARGGPERSRSDRP